MTHTGPRILLIGGTYRAFSLLERLIERGERVVAFIGQEGGSERDFCPEILEMCDRNSIPARSGRKLGEEIVRWLEDRIRPEIAIAVGVQGEIPVSVGGNCRLGLVEVVGSLGADGPREIALRQRGQVVLQRALESLDEDSEAGEVYLRMVDEMLGLIDEFLDRLGNATLRPRVRVGADPAPLASPEADRLQRELEPGPETELLERELAEWVGAQDVLALASAEDAFARLLAALSLRDGDEVILSGLCSSAVVSAVRACGAAPRFVDVRSECLTISPDRVRDALGERSRVLVVSHPFGQPAALAELYGIAQEAGLEVIEDAGQSLGARYGSVRLGRSTATCVFTLPLGAPLPAGAAALVTLSPGFAGRVDRASRLGAGAASVARARLASLEEELSLRRAQGSRYSAELSPYDAFMVPRTPADRFPTYAGYVLRLTHLARTSADDLHKLLGESGIEARRLHLPVRERELGDLPLLDEARAHALLLPIHRDLCERDLEIVLDTIFDYAIG